MFSLGSSEIVTGDDGYTYLTADGSLSAQFEHTIAITDEGPVILTQI
jgi:methionyl aminopeptidase